MFVHRGFQRIGGWLTSAACGPRRADGTDRIGLEDRACQSSYGDAIKQSFCNSMAMNTNFDWPLVRAQHPGLRHRVAFQVKSCARVPTSASPPGSTPVLERFLAT